MGNYKKALETNKLAIVADETYMSKTGQDNELYKMYRMHNYHFAVWAAMFEGQFSMAMQYAEAAERQLGPDAVSFNIGDFTFVFWRSPLARADPVWKVGRSHQSSAKGRQRLVCSYDCHLTLCSRGGICSFG